MNSELVKKVVEAALMVAEKPLTAQQLADLFDVAEQGEDLLGTVNLALEQLETDYEGRGIELKRVANGFRIQSRAEVAQWVNRLWEEKPARYSRAVLETLAIIAYRQPVTRAEIEEIRGVAVSSQIVKTLTEREWIKVAGHRDVPGRPAVYVTTAQFLDYFNLTSLADLPELAELGDLESLSNFDLEEQELESTETVADTDTAEASVEPVTEIIGDELTMPDGSSDTISLTEEPGGFVPDDSEEQPEVLPELAEHGDLESMSNVDAEEQEFEAGEPAADTAVVEAAAEPVLETIEDESTTLDGSSDAISLAEELAGPVPDNSEEPAVVLADLETMSPEEVAAQVALVEAAVDQLTEEEDEAIEMRAVGSSGAA